MWLTPGIGPVRFFQLLEYFGSSARVLEQTPADLRKAGLPARTADACGTPDWHSVESALKWAEQPDNHLILFGDSGYPELLKQIADPPPVLFARGQADLLSSRQLAIVGSRNPSPEGRRNARDFAAALCCSGLGITSGMALGIDGACHQGAMDAGGPTIAVLGTGADRVYPSRHHALAEAIAETGLLVTEYPLGTPVRAANFPRRNRIISGLSLGTLIVEAAVESGSLITARMALEQNREVFAIPGSIHNPLARGCNGLIRQGAKLVETACDILEELQMPACKTPAQTAGNGEADGILSPDQQNVLNSVAYAPTSMDTLVQETGFSIESLSPVLLLLELQGLISSAAGGCYYRLK